MTMNGKTAVQRHRKLTEKGQATRARILEQAAELIHTKGVAATNNEQLRRVTGISGSQLNHYFPTKESLVMAVIEWQTEQVMRFYGSEQFAGFDTIEALRSWVDYYVTHESAYRDGCTLGSLASQIIKSDLQVHDELARAFDQWRNIFRDGLRRMQSLGRLSATADPTQLADLLLSAFQGGMLLTQVQRDVTPLKNALHAAIDHVQTFAE
ncbi:transcriptional regulator, TetR family [Mycobacteroides abscessus subsp. bolletii 1S-154-0310]|uniref:Bacterial regulatory s, tetR family protein n=1 Tax=Mycobacteroides abscessus MAB_091912_2446 TaxID=1335414 RepID=A0A829MJT6_9MYCO|nr:transcriptional regulator, TetR family [Mycobacteroides abscessus subsp. bolletii 1S-151-0930]EIU70919.1 transcriptional regulator, TetR family [Mycobacteroides abscessus subsp. bolletii 1S-152-0914]EIU73508.1 transcriptional regulator, TetR family [Mycobacteroides abscessus subsp. bolletii 1S-153-0915]EIU77573.1 transcriptional regulator, TetR family [Mycobacteroides abscessus subsp. bolletii 2B-0626]EIU79246.1 transcriptional regulator, TetR family [Mycobacteroides abscessus subsp. bolleti